MQQPCYHRYCGEIVVFGLQCCSADCQIVGVLVPAHCPMLRLAPAHCCSVWQTRRQEVVAGLPFSLILNYLGSKSVCGIGHRHSLHQSDQGVILAGRSLCRSVVLMFCSLNARDPVFATHLPHAEVRYAVAEAMMSETSSLGPLLLAYLVFRAAPAAALTVFRLGACAQLQRFSP